MQRSLRTRDISAAAASSIERNYRRSRVRKKFSTGQAPWIVAPDFVAIPTPGHTDGHCVLLFQDRFLFTGDHLAWDRGTQSLSASEDYCWYSWPQQAESMERLAAYRFEWVLPGHGQRVHLSAAEMQRQLARLVQSTRDGINA